MGREFELKYRATQQAQAALKRDFPLRWQEISMETTYYDTPNRDLRQLRWTLRSRMENGVAVCTVKTPADDGGRGEWELCCGDIREAIPELCKLGAPRELLALTQNGLEAVCGAKFTRQAATLILEDCIVELALDSGLLLGGEKEMPLCEIEVEVKEGSEEAAVAFARDLAAKYVLTEEKHSKYRRALDLAKGE